MDVQMKSGPAYGSGAGVAEGREGHTILGLTSTEGRVNRQRALHLQMRQRSAHEGEDSEESSQHPVVVVSRFFTLPCT